MESIAEQALLLGPRQSLVGVITPGASAGRSGKPPFVVILNAGIIHRVGPHRLHVQLARALAAQGVDVLRVDLSGLGDSEPRDDGLPPLDASLADIRDVLDTLEATRQVNRVVLMGLCSGADHSVIYAGTDPRVVGTVLMDPSIPRTTRYYVYHYASRILSPGPWLNLLLGRHPIWQRLRRRVTTQTPEDAVADATRPNLEHPEVRAYLQNAYGRALAQGVQFLAVLTGDMERQHNHRRQLLDAFPALSFGSQLQLEYFRDCDHTFSSGAHRVRLIDVIVRWTKGTTYTTGQGHGVEGSNL